MFRLVFHLPGDAVQIVPLPDAETLTLGRGDDNAIRLDHVTVSRRHARLRPGPDGAWIMEDLQSSNGTRINGARLTRAAPLTDGDEVIFGEMAAVYRRATPEERAADAARDAEADPAVGGTFAARYRLTALHNETPEHRCFRAMDLGHAERPVNVKIFRPGVIEAAGGFRAVAERFATIQAAPAHPNIAMLYDFACWRETNYLVAGWTDGHPLLDVLSHRGALTVPDVLCFARQAAAATTHARAHRLPALDLGTQTMLISFDPPLAKPEAWTRLLGKRVGRWPAFTLKITPRLDTPPPAEAGYPFGALLCELLGADPPTSVPGVRPAPVHVATLDERGNQVLARGLSSRGEAYGGDAAFIEMLAHAADPRARR